MKLIKPRTEVDVINNRKIIAARIRGLVEAAKQIRDEEQRKREQVEKA